MPAETAGHPASPGQQQLRTETPGAALFGFALEIMKLGCPAWGFSCISNSYSGLKVCK